jgi:hypothetical protein
MQLLLQLIVLSRSHVGIHRVKSVRINDALKHRTMEGVTRPRDIVCVDPQVFRQWGLASTQRVPTTGVASPAQEVQAREVRRIAEVPPTDPAESCRCWSLVMLRTHLTHDHTLKTISHESLRQLLREQASNAH